MIAVAWGVGFMLAGGAAALALRHRPRLADRVFATLVPVGCGVASAPAIAMLARLGAPSAGEPAPPAGASAFGLDPLSAWFLILVLAVGAAASVFGTGYLAHERPRRPVAGAHALFAVLLAALAGVVTARGMVSFLACWEAMALSAYLLVVFESEQADVRRAGFIYLVLTHLSTLALIGMFAALSVHAGGHGFADFAAAARGPDAARTLVFALALLGFGIKAGVVPFHFWLPGAHAAAPSHASAVLSGVMLKAGIYGLLRVIVLLGTPPAWFGWSLLLLGLASGVLGVLWALAQHDLKRLLAYHSVENIGIILLGMGTGALGLVYGHPLVALLGFTGAVLHSLNHALFKSLLFLGAGAVVRATGTRRIDHLGGLARRMPLMALAFGVGSAAIVGLPPLNGFVSEWVVFRGVLTAAASHDPLRFAVIGAAGLALIGGLALACFSKLNGVLFLGAARAPVAPHDDGGEPRAAMLAPALGLALACALIGAFPMLATGPALRVATGLMGATPAPGGLAAAAAMPAAGASWMALSVLAAAGVLAVVRRRVGARPSASHVAGTWACAGAPPTPRMQYTASSFAAPLLTAFGPLAGVERVRAGAAFHSHARDLVLDRAALPTWHALQRLSDRLRRWQGASLRWYLVLVVSTLLALLYHLMRWRHAS